MYKELDTIYVIDAKNAEIILGIKKGSLWICFLCDEDEPNKVSMLNHIRNHIKVK